jgi:hypothetical protein
MGGVMSAAEPLCLLMGINPKKLLKNEYILLEADLFFCICNEVKEYFRSEFKEYFVLLGLSIEKENAVLEANLLGLMMKDILSTKEYTLEGIANYTDTPQDIVYEVFVGLNARPSAFFLRKLIELHRTVRRGLYDSIIKKIYCEHMAVA